MDDSGPPQKPGNLSEDQPELLPISVKPQLATPTLTTHTNTSERANTSSTHVDLSAQSTQNPDNAVSQTCSNTSVIHTPSNTPTPASVAAQYPQAHPDPCCCQTPASCASAAATPRSAEEGALCACQSSPPAASALLSTETELPGPSGRPCQALSLQEVRLGGCEDKSGSVASAPLETAAAAAEIGTEQASGTRQSTGSGIVTALRSVTSHTSFASPLSSIGPFCRICHEGESRELLISPCRCAGSVGLVHVSCIEKWLSAANKDSCEICMYKYVTERRPKPLLEWLLNPSNPEDARNLVGDVICFFLLTALAVIAAYLCLMGASHYLSYKTQWEATGLVVLGLLISSIYCVWLVVTCRYHGRVWRDWRRSHQDVHLLQMKRLSHSTVDINNNNSNTVTAGPTAATGAGCRACRGGSYSCSHCCAVCPVHGGVPDPAAAASATAGGSGADDVFDDGSVGGVVSEGGVCGATAATMEAGALGGAEK